MFYFTSNNNRNNYDRIYEIDSMTSYLDSIGMKYKLLSSKDMLSFDHEIPLAYYNFSGYPNHYHYTFLHYLESNQVKYINSAYKEIIALDKMMTGITLRSSGIKVPKSIYLGDPFISNYEEILNRVENEIGFPCVLKYPRSAKGQGIFKINDRNQLNDMIGVIFVNDSKFYGGFNHNTFIIEEFILSSIPKTLRVYVLNNEVIAPGLLKWTNLHWKTNLPFDENIGNIEGLNTRKLVDLDTDIVNVSVRINQLLGLNFSGIDYHVTDDGYVFNEVNPTPNYTIISRLDSSLNIGQKICDFILN